MTICHTFSHIQHGIHKSAHILQLLSFQIILRNTDIRFYYFTIWCIFPCSQSHMLFRSISTLDNKFRCRMPVHGIVHLILHLLIKQPCHWCTSIVIYGRSVYICQFLIKTPFTQSNLTDFSQQMLEIIFSDKRTVLHTLSVYHISSDSKLPEYIRTPLTKLSSPYRIDTITHCYDCVKIIEFNILS